MATKFPDIRNDLGNRDLSGKVAIVTGASRGIGKAISLNLACRGCNILGTYTSDASKAYIDEMQLEVELAFTSSSECPKIVPIQLSLDDGKASCSIADAVSQHFGSRVDIFINNAADMDHTPSGSLSAAVVAHLLFANIQTPAMVVDELVKRKFFQQNSRIIFISSAESTRCAPESLIYAATKSANEAMARCYANTFGGTEPQFSFMQGTTANSVSTGLTATQGPQNYGPGVWDALQESWVSRQSLPRLGQPEDVADVVGLLCSRAARWITGSKVSANGGSVKIL